MQFGDEGCAFTLGIVGVQAVDIGKQHQEIGVNVRHHQSGEFVVIAEDSDAFRAAGGAIELGGGNGVIFVDDGDNAELKQSGERGAKVFVAARIEKIVFRQQDLCHAEAQLFKGIVVHAHQPEIGRASCREKDVGVREA